MMGYGFLLAGLLWLFLLLGFAYIIWAMALKETGYVKTTGLVVACVIALLTVIIFLYGAVKGNQIRHNMMRGGGMSCPMMGGGMMGGKEGMKPMEKHMGKEMMKDVLKGHHKEMK